MLTRKISIFLLISIFLTACKKTDGPISYSEATYKVTVSGKWKLPEFSIPTNVHFTSLVGMIHNNNSYLFRPGSNATLGVERQAEDGNGIPLLAEIDTLISQKKAAASSIIFTLPYNADVSTFIYANSSYSIYSCMSMIAPTPDWFIGLHDFNLLRNGQWISDTTVNMFVYDAGTEDGDVFNQSGASTTPQQPVTLLTAPKATVLANGNATLAPMATIRFTRQ